MAKKTYTVVRDSQEQLGWFFPKKHPCLGTEIEKLPTGDYTLRGYEEVFIVERKLSTGELAKNIVEARFDRELVRLEEFPHAYLVCEFTLADVLAFPRNSGIPPSKWPDLKVTNHFLLKRLSDISVKHRVQIIFAGADAKPMVSSLFKRVVEHVQSGTP